MSGLCKAEDKYYMLDYLPVGIIITSRGQEMRNVKAHI
jgi:hypothetical protein